MQIAERLRMDIVAALGACLSENVIRKRPLAAKYQFLEDSDLLELEVIDKMVRAAEPRVNARPVTPTTPTCTRRYRAHIDVEVCSSIHLQGHRSLNHAGGLERRRDLDGRYLGPPKYDGHDEGEMASEVPVTAV
jgi:hypothetical protein